MKYDVVIVGSGPAGLGAAFELIEKRNSLSILIIDKERICSGGLLNDCKQNYTFPIGFTEEYWTKQEADRMLEIVEAHLKPIFLSKADIRKYQQRADRVSTKLFNIRQSHVGTDKSKGLIDCLLDILRRGGVEVRLKTEAMHDIDANNKFINIKNEERVYYDKLIIAPGRQGFSFLQDVMNHLGIKYIDNSLDVGVRVETRIEHYSIVRDYYDPKFYFPGKVRTFCTNSGFALVVKENYHHFYLVNGHALSTEKGQNGLINFAMLKSIGLEAPVRSGQQMALFLARLANEIGGGKPIMQRVGDFRAGKRSRSESFNHDLYDFKNTCDCTAGDLGLAAPSKIMSDIWKSMKLLDSIMPGLLHPSTIMYYPEIKMYANKPEFIDNDFSATEEIFLIGDGAGTSRGITGAWASGIRAARGILKKLD